MLEKPILADESIVECIWQEYGLAVHEVVFLPIGADFKTAVYRLTIHDETTYFLKLRRGRFDETAVTLPKFLIYLKSNFKPNHTIDIAYQADKSDKNLKME